MFQQQQQHHQTMKYLFTNALSFLTIGDLRKNIQEELSNEDLDYVM